MTYKRPLWFSSLCVVCLRCSQIQLKPQLLSRNFSTVATTNSLFHAYTIADEGGVIDIRRLPRPRNLRQHQDGHSAEQDYIRGNPGA
jgi:hypothetical protein